MHFVYLIKSSYGINPDDKIASKMMKICNSILNS